MAKKHESGKPPASDENRRSEQSRGRNSPAFPYEADENLHKTYEGYDEDRNSEDPRHEQDFEVDENNINRKRGQYKKVSGELSSTKRSNTNQRKKK